MLVLYEMDRGMYELLIDQVKKHEVLYNHASPEYRDYQIRQEAWEEIGGELQMTAEKVKELWDRLRRCFSNAVNRRRDPTSGLAIKKKHPWKYEEQMSFILPFLEQRRTKNKLNENNDRSEDNATESNTKEENLEDDEEVDDVDKYLVQEYISVGDETADALDSDKFEQIDMNSENPLFNTIEDASLRKRKCKDQSIQLQPKVPTLFDSLDETDLFFLSLSRMTKQLPKIEQANIKMTLSNAVLTAELRLAESDNWSQEEKRLFLLALRKYGDSDLSLLQTNIPHKTIAQIRGMVDHYKKLAQTKWLSQENRKTDEVRNWIDIMEKISSKQKGYIQDIIPRVLKYIALYEKNNSQSDIDLRNAYTFLSEVSYGKSTKELPERTRYFLYQCLVNLAENLQKQDIEENQLYLKQLESFEDLLKLSAEDELNPLYIPESLLHVSPADTYEDLEI